MSAENCELVLILRPEKYIPGALHHYFANSALAQVHVTSSAFFSSTRPALAV